LPEKLKGPELRPPATLHFLAPWAKQFCLCEEHMTQIGLGFSNDKGKSGVNQKTKSVGLFFNQVAILTAFAFLLFVPGVFAADYSADGPFEVETRLETWEDEVRGRTLPIKLYIPKGGPEGPTVIYSHGLGGSREGARYLGTRWASHGITGIFVQHPGSDISVWKGLKDFEIQRALRKAASDRQVAIDRFNDIPFVVDKLETLFRQGVLQGNLYRIGMAGHSFGARSTLIALGRGFNRSGTRQVFEENRIVAGLALSPEAVVGTNKEQQSQMYGNMRRPLFHITGTRDAAPLGRPGEPEDRQKPFAIIQATPQYLVVFDGADHRTFSGSIMKRRRPDPPWYKDVQGITAALSTAWWKAQLDGDEGAAKWLAGSGAANVLRDRDFIKSK
jgi:hypothetical protein